MDDFVCTSSVVYRDIEVYVAADSRMQSCLYLLFNYMIAMVVIQHPVKMYGVSEWKSTPPAFIYLTSIALYSEMSAMKVSSVRRADFIT